MARFYSLSEWSDDKIVHISQTNSNILPDLTKITSLTGKSFNYVVFPGTEVGAPFSKNSTGHYVIAVGQTLQSFGNAFHEFSMTPRIVESTTTHIILCSTSTGVIKIAGGNQQIVDILKMPESGVSIHTIYPVPEMTSTMEKWLAYHETATFESVLVARELIVALFEQCKLHSKRFKEDLATIQDVVKTAGTVVTPTNPLWAVEWDTLKFNDAERTVLRIREPVAHLKTVRILWLRWFLLTYTPETTLSSFVLRDFVAWLKEHGVDPTGILEVGTFLGELGFSSKRTSRGMQWPQLTDVEFKMEHIIDVAELRETDLNPGIAGLFAGL